MSYADLNNPGGILRCGQLILAGQTIVPGSITTTAITGQSGPAASGGVTISASGVTNTSAATSLAFQTTANSIALTGNISSAGGAGASLLGSASGSVATNTTGQIAVSVSPTAQTGVLTTATTMVLPPAGASGGVTSAVVGAGTPATGALVFAGSVAQSGNTFTFSGSGAGATITGDAPSSVPTNNSGNITMSVSPTAQTGVLTTATTIVLPPAGASGGGPLAWGYVVVPATPGNIINIYPTGGTAPAPAGAMVVQGGSLASSAQFTTSCFITGGGMAGTLAGTALPPPPGGAIAYGRPGSTQGYTTVGLSAGSFVAGQVLQWVLWAL